MPHACATWREPVVAKCSGLNHLASIERAPKAAYRDKRLALGTGVVVAPGLIDQSAGRYRRSLAGSSRSKVYCNYPPTEGCSGVIRLVTSWATDETQVTSFLDRLESAT